MLLPSAKTPSAIPPEVASRAHRALSRKRKKTPLEDALASGDKDRPARIAQWARQQWLSYCTSLTAWRENRRKWEQEAADVFKHRERDPLDEQGKPRVFEQQNDSLNVVASLAEFAAAQAEQDLFGGEPWFAAVPEGRLDVDLADSIQKHLQWTHRDGRLVQAYARGVTRAACLGEAFTKTVYEIEIDEYEAAVSVLFANGSPVMVEGRHVTSKAEADEMVASGSLVLPDRAKLEWREVFEKRQEVRRQGTETTVLDYLNVAFREDAPALELRFTNFYHEFEISVLDAMRMFSLSKEDAIKLAQGSGVSATPRKELPEGAANPDSSADNQADKVEFGDADEEHAFNNRVRLVEGFIRADMTGEGRAVNAFVVFPASGDDWLLTADYLANISPKGELPVKCHPWEEVPNRLYGRGFFAKYQSVQTQIDHHYNAITFRNRIHANPVVGYHPENLDRDDESDLVVTPGLMLKPKSGKTLKDVLEFAQFPDLDQRSSELMQIAIQMVQLRSGITSASQGDMSAVPENNTATGIRQLMSRAAVLLKKPIRGLRRSFTRDFSYNTRLLYANFDRDEAFVWGEGRNAALVKLTAEQVRNLEIDVRMLLTQEQNQTKLESAQVAVGLFTQWVSLPEIEKQGARPLFLQAFKALEYDQADEIIRQPVVALEDALAILPPDQQTRLNMLLQTEQQAVSMTAPQAVAPESTPTQAPLNTP